MNLLQRLKAVQPILLVALAAILLRAWAVLVLPQDYDEPVYLRNAFDYTEAIRSGSLQAVIDYSGNPEHPPFVRLLYAGALLALGDAATWMNALFVSRAISALFGVLAVLLLAVAVDPLAAGMLAVHTLAIKYTSEVYLEAFPHLMSLAAVLAFVRVEKGGTNRWFWLSAVALGMTAAGKYAYLPVLLVVLAYLAVFEKRIPLPRLLTYALLALAVFFALDVHLWNDPLRRLADSLLFHARYARGEHVQEVGYPWYQPLIWVFTAAPADWHPTVFFYGGFDGPIALLAVLGIWREWKERRWLALWLIAGLGLLLLWPTKWPQYALTLTPALCLMAAETLRRAVRWIRAQDSYWNYLSEMLPPPPRWMWVFIGLVAAFGIFIYASAVLQLTFGRIGWSNVQLQTHPLPGNNITALLPLPEGKILIGGNRGAVMWTLSEDPTQPSGWTFYQTTNSSLPVNSITALARDEGGSLWFGTPAGLSRFDGQTWQTFTAADLGLEQARILSLAACGRQVYAGTASGAALFDGAAWHPLEYAKGPVFALACRDEELWLALPAGAWRILLPSGQADFYPSEAVIRQFLFDSSGTLWAATSGAGLARWNGQGWDYFTPANSDLPHSQVNTLVEVSPGVLWLGTSATVSPGGAAVRFDGNEWQVFLPNNSGASGMEVTALAVQDGQVWMATRSAGIDIYQFGRTK